MPDAITPSVPTGFACDGAEGPRRQRLILEEMVPGLVGFADAAAVVTAALAIYLVRFDMLGIHLGWESAGQETYIVGGLLTAALVVYVFRTSGLYDLDTIAAWPRYSGRMVARIGAVTLLLTGLGFVLKVSDQFSRIWLLATLATSMLMIWSLRGAVAALMYRAARVGALGRTVALVGAGDQAQRFIACFQAAVGPWKRIVGVFDDRDKTRVGSEVKGIPLRGTVYDLVAAVRRREIDEVVITIPWNADERVSALMNRLRELPVDVYLGADISDYRFGGSYRTLAGGVYSLELMRTPLAGWNGVVKSLEDKVLAAIALLFFGPIMAIITVAVRLDSPGPVVFRQKRYGFNNELIEIFKFRTMHDHMSDENAETLTQKSDPRVTRVGRILRKTSLDELPQLYNVWNGTMSLVGPRPHATQAKAGKRFYDEVVVEYASRHRVKPGITGWAQINGWRGDTDSEEKIKKRVEYDLNYIENWSIWLDVRILLATVFLGWMHKNAY